MIIRDFDKKDKWSWVYIIPTSKMYFDGTVNYIFDNELIKFIRR